MRGRFIGNASGYSWHRLDTLMRRNAERAENWEDGIVYFDCRTAGLYRPFRRIFAVSVISFVCWIAWLALR